MNKIASSAFKDDRHDETDCREHPLQPILHSKLRKAPARMENQRDDSWTDAVKNCRHPGKLAEMDVERAERCHDQEIRQDEGPAARPCAPEAPSEIGGKNADLNR
jgi:hypothetical protein